VTVQLAAVSWDLDGSVFSLLPLLGSRSLARPKLGSLTEPWPATRSGADATELVNKMDADGDGVVTRQEFDRRPDGSI
jgi:hypothetical protein